jgi:putative ABC transport system permease protein
VAVIGSKVRDDFFGDSEAVGKEIKIKGQTYRVIGVLKKRGTTGLFDYDGIIDIPIQTVQKKIAGVDNIQIAIFKLKDMSQLDLTISQITDVLRSQHHIDKPEDDDFAVNSIQEVLDILDKVFFAVNALLLALTSISLLVGGVGIMNVMYVSVTERTFEIGLKKSVGARSFHILAQFLFEAIFLTFLGGILGLLAGVAVSRGAEILITQFGFSVPFVVTWWAAAIGIGFSATIGIVFGYFPARSASKMTPMEALRKE